MRFMLDSNVRTRAWRAQPASKTQRGQRTDRFKRFGGDGRKENAVFDQAASSQLLGASPVRTPSPSGLAFSKSGHRSSDRSKTLAWHLQHSFVRFLLYESSTFNLAHAPNHSTPRTVFQVFQVLAFG
jgi:hypothetical protein